MTTHLDAVGTEGCKAAVQTVQPWPIPRTDAEWDEFMIAQGFRRMTPEESKASARFFKCGQSSSSPSLTESGQQGGKPRKRKRTSSREQAPMIARRR